MGKPYLRYFSYVDWEVGENDRLNVGDRINCNHQRPHDGAEKNFEGKIVRHHINNLPVVLDENEDYWELQSLMMDGWEFSRLAPTNQIKKGE